MKEYICKEVSTDDGGYLEIETELIRCKDCRFYKSISLGSRTEEEHEGICCHPDGCIATDPWGYCHYALRKEDVPGEDK